MEEIQNVLKSILNIDFIRGTISGPRKKEGIIKVKVRPLEKRGALYFQLESFTRTQAFHENLTPGEAGEKIALYMEEFRQMQAETVNEDVTVLCEQKRKSDNTEKEKEGDCRKGGSGS